MDGVRTQRIGIASAGSIRKRTLEIARGAKLQPGEPKLWISSFESLSKVLSEKNILLLEMIRSSQPKSMSALAKTAGRKASNLSRTLHAMERLGLVRFEQWQGRKIPVVVYDRVRLECTLGSVTGKAA